MAMTGYWRQFGAFGRDARLYLSSIALQGFASGGIYAVLFSLYLLRLGYGPEFIGLVVAAGHITHVIVCPIAGALGSAWGSRRPMLAGVTLLTVGHGLAAISELIPTPWRATWVLATSILRHVGVSLNTVNANPFLMSATTPQDRHHAFATQSAINPLAGFAGSLIGGLMPRAFGALLGVSADDPAPYRVALLVASVLLIPALQVLLRTHEMQEARAPIRTVKAARAAPWAVIGMWSLTSMVRWAGRAPTNAFFNVYLDRALALSAAQIGAFSAVAKLTAVPAALVTPWLVTRWGRCSTVVRGTLIVAASLVLIALVPHWSAAGLGFIGFTALLSITSPVCSIFNQELVPPMWRPTMSGIISMAIGLGSAVMSLGGGYAIAGLGYQALFLVSAGLTALSAAMFWGFFRVPRGELARQSEATCDPVRV